MFMNQNKHSISAQYITESENKMKLVTFNIRCDYNQDGANRFEYRKPYILAKINEESPDILCFQEVLPHVAAWLKETLTDYYIIGCGRDEQLENEQISIAYKKNSYNLIQMETFWLSETPYIPGSRYPNQSDCPRVCTMALFQEFESNKIVRIYNTHLDHIGSEARALGLEQMIEHIKEQSSKEGRFAQAPTILIGDFNAFPDSIEMQKLALYPDLCDLTDSIPGTFHDYGRIPVPEKIDYIIAQHCIQCNEVSIWDECHQGVYLSDHYPVCANLQL
jgi:endonuclease/exonuclease/phosphatase family metal-dependent hydrolase